MPSADGNKYDRKFYRSHKDLSYRSAREVVPRVLGMMPVTSVCDIGCGVGTWLRAFREHGVADVVGIDGAYVTGDLLQIPAADFRPMDLRRRISLQRSFDLAMSLEVAEHLPENRAESFVADLTRLAPVVLFSAAIPGQGGVDHINEQWQTYWVALFAQCGYTVCDALRPQIWKNRRIAYWYRQNMMFFCNRSALEKIPALAAAPHALRHSLVHPGQMDLGDALRGVVSAVRKSIQCQLRQLVKKQKA